MKLVETPRATPNTPSEVSQKCEAARDSAGAAEGQSGRVIYARLGRAAGFKPGDFVGVAVEEPRFR